MSHPSSAEGHPLLAGRLSCLTQSSLAIIHEDLADWSTDTGHRLTVNPISLVNALGLDPRARAPTLFR